MTEDIFNRLQAAKNDEEREWLLLEMNLAQMSPDLQEAVWSAAIPHWFDIPFLAAVLAAEVDKLGVWEDLIGLSFVEPFPGRGYNIHERTRHLLLNKLWQENPDRFRELSQRAVDFCAEQDQDDPVWQIEWIYHLLVAEPDEGASQLQNNGWIWQNPPNFAYDLVEAMVVAAREQANGRRLNERCEGLILFWEAQLDMLYFRYPLAKKHLLQIQMMPKDDLNFTAEITWALGEAHLGLSEYNAARERYEEALPLYEAIGDRLSQANCIMALGDVHNNLKEYDAARQRYENALSIYKAIGHRLGEANCIKALGDIHVRLAEDDTARELYEAALDVYKEIEDRLGQANCIRALGDVHARLTEYGAARHRYETARPLYEAVGNRLGQANCIRALGDVHVRLSEYEAARGRYEEALSIYEAIGNRLGQANTITAFGVLEYEQKNYSLAQARFENAMDIYLSVGERTGQTYVALYLGYSLKFLRENEKALHVLETGSAVSRQIDGQPNLKLLENLIDEIKAES